MRKRFETQFMLFCRCNVRCVRWCIVIMKKDFFLLQIQSGLVYRDDPESNRSRLSKHGTWRKVNLNSYLNSNGYCADRSGWAEILCCSYSAFATVLDRTVPP